MVHAECAWHEGEAEVGGGLFCAHIPHPPTIVSSQKAESLWHLLSREAERGTHQPREWSREEGAGEIQEGIWEEEACSWP